MRCAFCVSWHIDGAHARLDRTAAITQTFGPDIMLPAPAQGALAVGYVATVMGQMAAKAPNPGAVSYRYDITFLAPVYIGDTVTARLTLVEKDDDRNTCVFDAAVTNQAGVVAASGRTYLKVL